MIYKEEVRDLFTVPEDYYLAHCISADFGMGKGIAVQFNLHYDMKNKLKNKYVDYLFEWDKSEENQGACILEGRVFNLITKRNYWGKPTYRTLHRALRTMKNIAIDNGIKKIAMPLIGCGLDRLDWNEVSNTIQREFNDVDIEILVCKQHTSKRGKRAEIIEFMVDGDDEIGSVRSLLQAFDKIGGKVWSTNR